MKYLIANWKQNKTYQEYLEWRDIFFSDDLKIPESLVFIIAPNYLQMPNLAEFLIEKDMEDIFLASQDISQYTEGKHTGLIGADQVADFATFTIIGHSEKRKDGDTPIIVNEKINRAFEINLTPIVCFSSKEEYFFVKNNIDTKKIIFAYEPLSAIGSGNPETPEAIIKMANDIDLDNFLYGGSVDVDNISDYLKIGIVTGFLVGTASLDPIRLKSLINKLR